MRNSKSKTIRKIGPASTSAIVPPAASRRACPPPTKNETPTNPKSRNTQHAIRSASSGSRITNHASLLTNHAPRTRNGKVARLPYAVRDMINRMLRNNIPHSQIADALDELQFKVTERNISNWKTRGGYRDWCIAQDRALETRLLQDNLLENLRKNDASQLAEVGLQLVATELSQFFLKPETRQQLSAEPEKLARTIGILCRLARQIHVLQKYRDQSAIELGPEHNPELLKHETDETLDSIRDTYSAEKVGESAKEPTISHRNFLPKNGFPPDLPPDPPRDDSEFHHRTFQKFCDIFAEKNARRLAEAEAAYRTTPQSSFPGSAARAATDDSPEQSDEPGSAARAASSDFAEPEQSDDATAAADQPEPDAPHPELIPKNDFRNPASDQ